MYAQVMGLGTFFAGFGEKIKKLPSVFSGLFSGLSSKASSVHGSTKINPKIVMVVVAAIMVIIALLLVLAIVSHPKTGPKNASILSDYANEPLQRDPPAEEFFLPYEPDFVPDVLLEREPKESWIEEDARPFWTDPLEGNEGVWRKRIESGIDSLLENVP